jgi:hypothetical protein
MKSRARSTGYHSMISNESINRNPDNHKTNPLNLYKNHYYQRIAGAERDTDGHSPVDLINYSLIKKNEKERVLNTSNNDS